MNRYNDWQTLLKFANEDLEKFGYSLMITEPEQGNFDCEVWKDGNLLETYAGGYYEDELSGLVTDAMHYVLTEYVK